MSARMRNRLERIVRRLNIRALSAEVAADLWWHGLIGERELTDAQLEAVANSSSFDWRDFTDAEVEDIASGRRSPQGCVRRRQRCENHA